jgi:hypothetical protein
VLSEVSHRVGKVGDGTAELVLEFFFDEVDEALVFVLEIDACVRCRDSRLVATIGS